MDRQTRYPKEARERAVRLVFEHEREYASQWAAITSISAKLGMTAETLRTWVRRAETDEGLRPGLTTGERKRLKLLERENRELLAESVIGLYKADVIRHEEPWKGLDDVEYATLEWVDWFNNKRLLEPIGNIPPAEAEARYHTQARAHAMAA